MATIFDLWGQQSSEGGGEYRGSGGGGTGMPMLRGQVSTALEERRE